MSGDRVLAGTGRSQVADAAAYPTELQERVDSYLEALRFAAEPGTAKLEEAMRYSLLAGGKRIRPVLALATAEAVGRDPGEVLPLAAAIEMIHTYSLIHDDLPAMDDDELRRGKPTCHVAFGEDVAILAGDGLFAEALRLALEEQTGDPANVLAAVRELVTAAGTHGMVGGQFLDVAGGDGPDLRRLHELKTGALIAAAVECAAALAAPPAPVRDALRRFAIELGVLFQIVDDVLDATGTVEALGKPARADEAAGRRTYVTVLGLEAARERIEATRASALAPLDEVPGDTAPLRAVVELVARRTS